MQKQGRRVLGIRGGFRRRGTHGDVGGGKGVGRVGKTTAKRMDMEAPGSNKRGKKGESAGGIITGRGFNKDGNRGGLQRKNGYEKGKRVGGGGGTRKGKRSKEQDQKCRRRGATRSSRGDGMDNTKREHIGRRKRRIHIRKGDTQDDDRLRGGERRVMGRDTKLQGGRQDRVRPPTNYGRD
ncbi:protein lingerer-like [Neodiprion virginianus]|uniref:protein lingerer-like n=1 Tax=Neodiprion virginianus TaxID=2961670 RepID=UPI001EE6F1C0|nr:protein lingerer-like [Neodiprion virginianus]